MCVIVLILAIGAGLVVTGIAQGSVETAVIGGAVLVFLVWALVAGGPTDENSGDAGDGDA